VEVHCVLLVGVVVHLEEEEGVEVRRLLVGAEAEVVVEVHRLLEEEEEEEEHLQTDVVSVYLEGEEDLFYLY
jgi:hypothetical protein